MLPSLNHETLQGKEQRFGAEVPNSLRLRVHRSISWIGRAERAEDDDARFVFFWIAFNAAYADASVFGSPASSEQKFRSDFFQKAVSLDTGQRIYGAIWTNFSGPIRLLIKNKYVFGPFWQHHNGVKGTEDWADWFAADERRFRQALSQQDTEFVLDMVFDRLSVLRNQLVHGGATWGSSINRAQVHDGTAILAFLIPVFVDVMLDNPLENWGRPFYPVVAE